MATSLRRLLPSRVANTGSQQRDHHANERTFLSWTRAGLGFAAMALALDRLDAIDRLLTSKLGLGSVVSPPREAVHLPFQHDGQAVNKEPHGGFDTSTPTSTSTLQFNKMGPTALSNAFSASRLCQLLGLWSLGYGFFRYWSMRRYLLKGQFVPAFWGPVLMTTGSFAAFMTLGLQMDRRNSHSHSE